MKRGMYKEAEDALQNALKGGDAKKSSAYSKFLLKFKRPSKKTRARYKFS